MSAGHWTPDGFVHTGPFDAGTWIVGARVRFADDTATVDRTANPDPAPVIAEGLVNGPALESRHHLLPAEEAGELDDPPLGTHWLVPCWTEREGREATSVYVDSRNVVGVILPEPYAPADRGRHQR